MHTLITLVGPHSSGKTTIGKLLAKALNWKFDDEIGYRFRQEALAESQDNHAHLSPAAFDWKISLEEIKRDQHRSDNAVVETWHAGNLAYIQSRNPEQYEFIKHKISSHLEAYHADIIVVPLDIKLETLRHRQHELGPDAEYFWRVGKQATLEAFGLGLQVLDPIQTDVNLSPEQCVQTILSYLQEEKKDVQQVYSKTRARKY